MSGRENGSRTARAGALLVALEACHPRVRASVDLEHSAQIVGLADPTSQPRKFPEALLAEWARIRAEFGEVGITAFDQMLFCWLLGRSAPGARTDDLPPLLGAELAASYDRILDRTEANLEAANPLKRDLVYKDLGLCTRRLLPAGSSVLGPKKSLPPQIMRYGGVGQALAFAALYLGRFHGRGPFLRGHFHPEMARYFTQAGREHSFRVIASILRWRPSYKALVGDAWFYDPVVAEISPQMAYVRALPEAQGALFFRGPPDDSKTALTSPKRLRLYREGKYQPRRYFMVWPRDALLDWAARQDDAAPPVT